MKNNVLRSGLVVLSLVASAQVYAAPGTAVAPRNGSSAVESRGGSGAGAIESRENVVRGGSQGASAVRGSTSRSSLEAATKGSKLTTKGSDVMTNTSNWNQAGTVAVSSKEAKATDNMIATTYGADVAQDVQSLKPEVRNWAQYHLLAIAKNKSDKQLNETTALAVVAFAKKFGTSFFGTGVKEQEECWNGFGDLAVANAKHLAADVYPVIKSAEANEQGLAQVRAAVEATYAKLTGKSKAELKQLVAPCRVISPAVVAN